ncbi:cytochrome P450 [Paenibacillus algorifonticola]|uniref:cytochrome P450 family protein n=1 Tax=Paenibacillus algorifonticola TaxID=684063 RepID=UPI003D2C6C6E
MSSRDTIEQMMFTPEFKQNPYPVYEKLRASNPIFKQFFPNGHYGWIVTKYEDAVEVLKDPRFIKDIAKVSSIEQTSVIGKNMLFSDLPDHKRLRSFVQKGFTPQIIAGKREHIQKIADELLDAVAAGHTMNLIDDYAFHLPIIVICEILGIPAEDREQFRSWSNTIIEASFEESSREASLQAQDEFVAYLKERFDFVREHPSDDLISQLVVADESGDQLTEGELYGVVTLLIIAGHETTVNLIGNGVLALLEHPEQREQLLQHPEYIHGAIEEMLRYNGPVEFSTGRWASEDLEFKGHMMQKNDMVIVALDSANRDPEHFNQPDVFDISRGKSQHLAFGKGIHLCLGAPLARLEGEIAINTLLRRFPRLELQANIAELEWRPGMIVRGVKEIPLSI